MDKNKKATEINDWQDIDDWQDVTVPVDTDEDREKYSTLESLTRGAAQGASFGFADELTAALESALTEKSYEDAVNESRAEYAASSEEDPITALLGNLIGGVAVPGIGAIKAGSSAAKLLQAGQLAKAGASGALVKTAIGGGAELAAGGALAGVGASEKEGLGLVEDAATGAGLGLLGGAAIAGTTGLIRKGVEVTKKTQLAKDIAEKYALSKQYGSQIGKVSENKKALDESIKKIVTELRDAKKENVKDYSALLAIADKESTSVAKVSDMVSKLEDAKIENPGSATELQEMIDSLNNIAKRKIDKVEKLVPEKMSLSKIPKKDTASLQAQIALQTKRTEFHQKIDFLSKLLEKTDDNGMPLLPEGKKRNAIIKEMSIGLDILNKIEQDPTIFLDKNGRYGASGVFDSPESFINRMKPIEKEVAKGLKVVTGYELPELRMAAKGAAKPLPFRLSPEKLSLEKVDEAKYIEDIINPSKAQEIKTEIGDIMYGGGKFPVGMTKTLGSDILSQASAIRSVADDTLVGEGLKAADITHKGIKEAEELLKDIDVQGLNKVSEEQKLIALNKFARKLAQDSEAGITANDTMEVLKPRLEQVLGKEKAEKIVEDLYTAARKYKVSADLGQEAAFGGLNPTTLGMPQRTAALTAASEIGNFVGTAKKAFDESWIKKSSNEFGSLIKKAGVKAGLIKPEIADIPVSQQKEAADWYKIVDKLDPESAQEITNHIIKKDPKLGNMFSRVMKQPGQKRRAALWALMQQPSFRSIMFEGEDEQ